jgi:hypothetical protein
MSVKTLLHFKSSWKDFAKKHNGLTFTFTKRNFRKDEV